MVIAEVSFPSTGQGIELGWADYNKIKLVCVYKKDQKISGSLKSISKDFLPYSDNIDLINQLINFLK